MNTTLAHLRIEENEVSKLTEQQLEYLMTNFHLVITQGGKDAVISVPYDDYVKLQEAFEQQVTQLQDIADHLKKE